MGSVHQTRQRVVMLWVLLCGILMASAPRYAAAAGKIEPALVQELRHADEVTAWIVFADRADLGPTAAAHGWAERGASVMAALRQTSAHSQRDVRALLDTQQVAYEAFWIANAIHVRAGSKALEAIAAHPHVQRILADRSYVLQAPLSVAGAAGAAAPAWGVAAIHAPEVWSTYGVDGDSITVATIDTGVDAHHPALRDQYRGSSGAQVEHAYHWFDATGVCGGAGAAPCDEHGHGTHVMGSMVGAEGGQAIGVAPGARWMAAKACVKFMNDSAICSLEHLLRAGQWMLAPTDELGGQPRPELRPHVLNNSWGGPPGDPIFRDMVQAWTSAGIFTVFSSGNMGPDCQSAGSPGDYPEAYSVGAYDSLGDIAVFSGRGGSDGGISIKPNIAAPGVDVWSSVPGGGYQLMSGTSMAAPHVAGTVALLWSAAPSLRGDLGATRALLNRSAIDVDDTSCGGSAAFNNVWGEGRLDALAAVQLAPHGLTATLTGSVRDARRGTPLGGAEVVISSAAGSQVVITDQHGRYLAQLRPGTYRVVGEAFGYEVQRLGEITLADGGIVNTPFLLSPKAHYRLAGVARNEDGRVLRGVEVSLPGTPLAPVRTDASGSYRFEAVPAGSYTIHAEHGGCLFAERAIVVDRYRHQDLDLKHYVDGAGYACTIERPDYIEAETPLPLRGYRNSYELDLPFAFTFYGQVYTRTHITTDGFMSFVQPEFVASGVLPHPIAPNAAIYPFWTDVFFGPDSAMYTQTIGRNGQRQFIIEWRNVYLNDFVHQVDFEVILTEQGDILMQYQNLDGSALENGAVSTIGLENEDGSIGFLFSRNVTRIVGPEFAIRYKVIDRSQE